MDDNAVDDVLSITMVDAPADRRVSGELDSLHE
jgi:hypothetical protein